MANEALMDERITILERKFAAAQRELAEYEGKPCANGHPSRYQQAGPEPCALCAFAAAQARLDWLLDQLQKFNGGVFAIHNPHTGYFIRGETFHGYVNGDERITEARLAQCGRDGSFCAAIDKAIREGRK